jgi:Tol biopolymer transport system component
MGRPDIGFIGDRAGCVAVLVAALLLSIVPAAQATFPGQNGRIAFTKFDGIHLSIYTITPDGSDLRQVVTGAEGPAWSADGRKLAYFRDLSEPNRGLTVADADGSGPVIIRPATADADQFSSREQSFVGPAWSPDGGTIAYEEVRVACSHPSCIVAPMGIRAIGADGSGDHLLPLPSFGASNPAYAPDGSRLAWDDGRVHIAKPDGTDDIVLREDVGGRDPSWSPDGARIAFWRYIDSCCNSEIHVMNADGTDERRLTFESGPDFNPAWSPDGTMIAWTHLGELRVMNADGSEQSRLAEGSGPDWQPLVGPRRADYKNASHFCKAEREFLGAQQFGQKYGNHGGCVTRSR